MSRLERLRRLVEVATEQLEAEELATGRARAAQAGLAYPAVEDVRAFVRVPVSDVAAPAIRTWARANRYDVPVRGRLDQFVVGAYVEAHQ